MAAFDLRKLGQMNAGMGAFAPVGPEPVALDDAAAGQGIDIASFLAPPTTAQPNFLQKVGAVLADTASGLRGDLGAQGHPSASAALAAKRVSPSGVDTQQLAALGKALFPDDPKAQFLMATGNKDFLTALSDQYKVHTINGGDSVIQPDGSFKVAPKLTTLGDQFFTQDENGATATGRRDQTYAETEDVRHNTTTEGLTAAQQAEIARNNAIQAAIAKDRLGIDRAELSIAQGGLDLRRQEFAAEQEIAPHARAAERETALRKEFGGRQEVQNFRTISSAANQVQALANAPSTAQNDIALIYSAMKAYDPNSVVRETEFATAQNAAGVPDKIRNQWNKVLQGERLNPTQRKEMAQSVATVARTSGDNFAKVADSYRAYAAQAGANPDNVAKYERKATGGGPKVLKFDAQGNLVK